MVVACEALKPSNPQYDNHNVYQVVEALLGVATSDRLKKQKLPVQLVRNAHLHRGEFHSSESVFDILMHGYRDPTFDETHRELWDITQATIIEWLRRNGAFAMAVLKERKTFRRRIKDHIFSALGLMLFFGIVLGWIFRHFWDG